MCRLLGIVVRRPQGFRRCLLEAPRSLAVLGQEHADGWGIAVHDGEQGWTLTKQASGVGSDPAFDAATANAAGALLVAHVRKRTVGDVSLENTHPFRRGAWVFAHNGTIDRMAGLRDAVASAGAMPTGQTDSELVFAFLLAQLAAHPGALGSRFITDMVLARAVEDLARMPALGTATFVLSDGVALYAYRHGRPLYLLERRSQGRLEAILVASEPATNDEPWVPVPEGALLALWRRPLLGWGTLFVGRRGAEPAPKGTSSRPPGDAASRVEAGSKTKA